MRLYSKIFAVAMLAAGCGGKQVASRYVLSIPVKASDGAALSVSATEDPQLAGAQLLIPPHALSADTTITLELGEASIVGAHDKAAGPVAVWGPPGTVFKEPVQMTLPIRLSGNQLAANLFIQVLENGASTPTAIGHSHLSINAAAGTVQFAVQGFTSFQPGTAGSACASDRDCSVGDVCVNGACQAADDGGCFCANGQACDANGGCSTFQCRSDSDCPAGDVCEFFSAGNDAGVTTTGSACVSVSDGGPQDGGPSCGNVGQVCCGGGFFAPCNDPSLSCNGNNVCVPNSSDAGQFCRLNADCPNGEVCDPATATCVFAPDGGPSCATDCRLSNCAPPPNLCGAPQAVASCDPANGQWFCSIDGGRAPICTVGADQTCNDLVTMNGLAGTCQADASGTPFCACNAGFVIDPATGRCAPGFTTGDAGVDGGSAPQRCSTTANCSAGQTCVNGFCQ